MKYLIWSIEHGMWWKPYEMGYTKDIYSAGRYTAEEAVEILCMCSPGQEIPVKAEQYSPELQERLERAAKIWKDENDF